jgi:pimeloyl-ACP methyl ester carboxylesterase
VSPDDHATAPPAFSPVVAAWEARGTYLTLGGRRIFTVDLPAIEPSGAEPVLLLHGFPTSSFDYHLVAEAMSRTRRVLSLDFLGFGLSEKPDIAYTVDLQADLVMDFLGVVDVEAFALLTHDLGDTVGGELLARHLDGIWPVDVTKRVVTNGSIYIEMARLTPGQELLLALPDELLAPGTVDGPTLTGALTATMGPGTTPPVAEINALWELVAHDNGDRLLARLIRYIEDRRVRQARFTGAIERHPSPVSVIWGTEDPVAVPAMTTRLAEARPDARVVLLPGVGHYPMLEAPRRFIECATSALS